MQPIVKAPFVLGLCISLFAALSSSAPRALAQAKQAAAPDDTWEQYRETRKRHPNIVRYYTFETVSADDPVAPSLAGEPEPLRYVAEGPPALVEGRRPGKNAVRLDRGFFEAKPFEVRDASFTVEMWFRKHGQGVHLGNGRTSGMLFAQGDGYWNGVRVWTSYPTRRLQFEIGRPKPSNAFGFATSDSAPDGVWHHLAATWDGREMRLYLNGILLQAVAYAGDYTAPSGPLRIGFAGAGVGSVEMDVDEVAVYDSALSPVEILRHAHWPLRLPEPAEKRFLAGTTSIARGDWAAAETQFAAIGDLPDASPPCRAVARMALAQSLRNQNRVREAIAQYTSVVESADAPEPLREIAVRRCLPSGEGAVEAVASRRVYERLLGLAELSEQERIETALCLAECHLREGDAASARKQYETVLRAPGLAERDAWNVRLQIAHTFLAAKDYPAARAEYAKLASSDALPPEFRANALLCVAHTHVREKAYAAAADAFAKVGDCPGLPAHYRQEAEERIVEMKRLAQGLPARDPADSRVKLPPPPEPGLALYVAPDGDDGNPGTKERPLAGLEGARGAIRRAKSAGGLPKGGVTVFVRGGSYPTRQTFALTEADSGTPEAPVVYRAVPGESPRFVGGVTLGGFGPVVDREVLARLPEEARGRVLQVDLPRQGVTDFGQIEQRGYGLAGYPTHPWVDLYVDGEAMPLARWPNEGFVRVGKVHQGQSRSEQARAPGRFEYEGDRPNRWAKPDDVWMFGYWVHLWAGRSVEVAQIDPQSRSITTVQPASYGYREGQPYYYFNLLEELDRPGEWYLDRRSGVLYLYPPHDLDRAEVRFPILAAPFVTMENTSHVTIRGLTFELGRAEGAVVTGGAHDLLAGCTFRQLGANGVVVRGGTGHGVLGCDVGTLGAGGCRIEGGDRKTLTPGGHFVENCHIHDFSRVDRVYAPAVHMDGVGNRIAHNLFHDSPHHAMRVEGYDHVIEMNEIHSVVYEADDQAGIDMFGNPAYRGNVIRYNFWHHVGSGHNVAGQAGIRLDDFISAVRVYGNVFYRCSGGRFGGVQIHGGKDNVVDNNLFIHCKQALSCSPWGHERWLERLDRDSTKAAVARGGVDVAKPPHSTRYPDLARIAEDADRNFLWRNLAVDCGRFSVRDRGVNERMDNHAIYEDPGFADPAKRNFALPEDSPIYDRFGFRPVPFDEIGLYEDEYRATWPVEHQVTPHYVPEY